MSIAIISRVIGVTRKAYDFIRPSLPTIAVVSGVACVGAGAFVSCKATLKLDAVIEEHKAALARLDEESKQLPEGAYTDIDRRGDKFQIYCATSGKLFRLYAPGISLLAGGIGLILGGYSTMKAWYAGALSAFTALDNKFRMYRGNVINDLGTEADAKYIEAPVPKKIVEDVEVDPDTGETTKVEKVVVDVDSCDDDDFTFIYDSSWKSWENNYLFSQHTLKSAKDTLTLKLQAHEYNHVYMNDYIRAIDPDGYQDHETNFGHYYGWTDRPGCGVHIKVTPALKIFTESEEHQFPMLMPYEVKYDGSTDWWNFANHEDYVDFQEKYAENPENICFIVQCLVDSDDNGVPREIISEVYNTEVRRKRVAS